MNSRYPTSDVAHQRNHRYDPAALATEQAWAHKVVDAWTSACEDEAASVVNLTLKHEGLLSVRTELAGERPVDAKTMTALTLQLQESLTDQHTLGTYRGPRPTMAG